jgi:hypothetical protein
MNIGVMILNKVLKTCNQTLCAKWKLLARNIMKLLAHKIVITKQLHSTYYANQNYEWTIIETFTKLNHLYGF